MTRLVAGLTGLILCTFMASPIASQSRDGAVFAIALVEEVVEAPGGASVKRRSAENLTDVILVDRRSRPTDLRSAVRALAEHRRLHGMSLTEDVRLVIHRQDSTNEDDGSGYPWAEVLNDLRQEPAGQLAGVGHVPFVTHW